MNNIFNVDINDESEKSNSTPASKNSAVCSPIDSLHIDKIQYSQTEEIKNDVFAEKYSTMLASLEKINNEYDIKKNDNIRQLILSYDNIDKLKKFAIESYEALSQITELHFDLEKTTSADVIKTSKNKRKSICENMIGKTINDYTINENLTNNTFLVTDKNTNRKYEMKIISSNNMVLHNTNNKILTQIAENMKQIDHCNILKIHHVFEEKKEKKIYLITKHITGKKPIEKTSKSSFTTLELDKVISYTKQIINGLSILHSQNVVYFNFNLDNLEIDDNDNVYLIDYWINNISQNKYNFLNKYKLDALFFSPPETLSSNTSLGAQNNIWSLCRQNNILSHGAQNNIWSLGIIVFLMLYGYYPFWGETYEDLKNQILHKDPVYPTSITETEKDFFKKIFNKDPFLRMTSSQMTKHPFLRFNLSLKSCSSFSASSYELMVKPPLARKSTDQSLFRRQSFIRKNIDDLEDASPKSLTLNRKKSIKINQVNYPELIFPQYKSGSDE